MVTEVDDLRRLEVTAPVGMTTDELARCLTGLGAPDGAGHVWLDIVALRKAGGRSADPDWSARFDVMISFAQEQHWVGVDGTAVRAHLVRVR
ncbi:hypothetical protein TEK04_05495 [Klenkia sp. LSe6-5]|uniref:Uncharacterized protein n=1 Tax=Klenkia sesuvii TaxID=3103137 RepID=A0ABU8DRB2_9ACTN